MKQRQEEGKEVSRWRLMAEIREKTIDPALRKVITLKIITWNVRGLQSERLRKKKVLFLQKLDYDILCLQELRLKTKEDIEELIKLWGPSHSVVSIGEDSADGVGFFFKNTHVNIIKKRDIIPGRLLLVDCHYGGQKFRLINKMRHLLECGFNTVLCGDFNMVTEENDRIASTIFKESREGKLLTQICNDASLRDLYRILNPQTIHFTRFDSFSKTRIDRIYISSEIVALRYNDFVTDFSDHKVVRATILCGTDPPSTNWKLNTTLYV
uniref:exodeoxyribonuclease III n=1 Tax=Astatotilapia calliptera TaxID=8154 RepID=A0A3P8RCS1_ASTCA